MVHVTFMYACKAIAKVKPDENIISDLKCAH